VTTLFSVFLVLSLAIDAAVVFSPERVRRRVSIALVTVLVLVWIFFVVALIQIALRTENPLVPSAGIHRPGLVESARHEVLVVLASLGGPAVIATFLGVLAIRGSRRRRPRPGHMERLK
jgi:TRAP-type C4-dicarboxylate transport system permease small subunit